MSIEPDISYQKRELPTARSTVITRVLYWYGPVERTIDLILQPNGEWSVYFAEFADPKLLRIGEHWFRWGRGTGPIDIVHVVHEMTKFLTDYCGITGCDAVFAIVAKVA